MGQQMGFRALMATKPTLKWFIVIGFVITIIGVVLSFFIVGGWVLFWLGLLLTAFSLIALLYLWLTERFLARPQRHPPSRR
jgi:membrane protein implicated in regulation of membrane protease activity